LHSISQIDVININNFENLLKSNKFLVLLDNLMLIRKYDVKNIKNCDNLTVF